MHLQLQDISEPKTNPSELPGLAVKDPKEKPNPKRSGSVATGGLKDWFRA